MSNETMKIKEIIEQVNAQLKANFEKEVILVKENYGRSSLAPNSRKVISIWDAARMIGDIADNSFSIDRADIRMGTSGLVFKTKRKKSGIKNWNYADSLTVVEIYVEDEKHLDMTLGDFIDAQLKREKDHADYEEQKYNSFLAKLKEKGMSMEEFKQLKESFGLLDSKYRY